MDPKLLKVLREDMDSLRKEAMLHAKNGRYTKAVELSNMAEGIDIAIGLIIHFYDGASRSERETSLPW